MESMPSNIINFNFHSEQEDQTYKGVFQVRRISVFGANEIQIIGNTLSKGLGIANVAHAEMVRKMSVVKHMIEKVLEGKVWYDNENISESWSKIFDMKVLDALYEEVVNYDEWFRLRNKNERNKEENKEEGKNESSKSVNSTDDLGRKKPKHEQEESGVRSVVIG